MNPIFEDPGLDALPDDVLQQIVAACYTCADGELALTDLDALSGLGCLCKDVLQQLHRLRPIVRVKVHSLVAAQHQAGPWRVVLLYTGELTEEVVEQAAQGRVFSINYVRSDTLSPAVAKRVVPELLGADCSLLELKLDGVRLNDSWAATFGEAAVCNEVLHELKLDICGLRGPLPELRLPALQGLFLFHNRMTGGLDSLKGCKALRELDLSHNTFNGGLEPLMECAQLEGIDLSHNRLTGGLVPLHNQLHGETKSPLQFINLSYNLLTGGLEPLKGCKVHA